MDHADHVNLLRNGIEHLGGAWADFGAGTGAFTLALADILGPGAEIYAIDMNEPALQTNELSMDARFPATIAHYRTADFTRPLELPPLDGIVMANSLHFQRHQEEVVSLVRGYLAPGGRLLIVEYNIAHGNFAVPHPVPYSKWQQLASHAGFTHTEELATRPSRFLKEIYSAVSR
ncbi:MAG: class I SAM-dependent methyltransferase [Tepidiformaceae bacterium]